eukprot:scaffold22128_cov39-Attheya_sp.AAC.3
MSPKFYSLDDKNTDWHHLIIISKRHLLRLFWENTEEYLLHVERGISSGSNDSLNVHTEIHFQHGCACVQQSAGNRLWDIVGH